MLSANITSASVEFRSKPTCTALSKTDVESRRGGGGSVVFPLSRKCSTQVQVNEMSARGYHAAVIVSNKQLPLQHDDHSSLHIPAVYVTTATAHFLKRVNERINIQFTSAMLVPNTIVHGRETTTNTTTTTAAVWLNEHQLLRHAVAAYKAITTPRGKMKHIATLASMQDVVSLCAHSLFLEPRFADSYIVMSNTLHAMNRTTAANLTLTQWLSSQRILKSTNNTSTNEEITIPIILTLTADLQQLQHARHALDCASRYRYTSTTNITCFIDYSRYCYQIRSLIRVST